MTQSPTSVIPRFAGLLLSAWLAVLPLQGAKAPAVSKLAKDAGPIIEMSPFEVRAQSMEFDRWIKMESPHFLIYTDASTKEATRLLKEMEMVHQAAQFYFKRKAMKRAKRIVVLPTGKSDWRKLASKGGVEWAVASSLTGQTRELLLVQYDWQEDGLGAVWSMAGHSEIAGMNIDGPFWFRRGVARFFGTVEFTHDTLTIGKESDYSAAIIRQGWMPWDQYFSITARSPEFTKDTPLLHQFEGQSAVFTHYFLTSSDPAGAARLLAWAAYLEAGNPPTKESFKELFGVDWSEWETLSMRILKGGTYTTGVIRFPPAALNFPVTKLDLSVREMRELFILSQIMNQRTKESDTSLDALLLKGLKTESLREVLADACDSRSRNAECLIQQRALIAAGTTNQAVYTAAATAVFKASIKELSPDARLGDATEEIRSWCTKALALEPLDVQANETLAWTEALAPTVGKSNLDTIARICRTLDGTAPTDQALAALAVARWRAGANAQARALCERIDISVFTRKSARGIVHELLAKLDAGESPNPTATLTPP